MYTSVSLTPEVRDALRKTVLDLTSPAGRRLTLSEVLLALIHVGETRRDEVLTVLADRSAQ